MPLLTANPTGFMNNLKKQAPNALAATQAGVSPTNNVFNAGVQAKSPEQNIKPVNNTIQPNQVRTTAPTTTSNTATPKTFTDAQSSGLMAALGRKNAGTANDADNKNLAYATSNGWKPTATTTTTAPVAKPTDISSGGIITNMVDAGNNGTKTTQAATTGLLNTAANNPATSGQAYTDYQNAIKELADLKSNMATAEANISSTGIPLEFQQGRSQVLNKQYADQLEAAQAKVNQAQAAIGQQITGTQTQQSGLQSAGSLGTTSQGLLANAAEQVKPVQVSPSNQYVNPQTGENVGQAGIGGSLDSAVSNIAEKVQNGTMGYDAGVAALNGYGQLGLNALQQKLGTNFNVQQSNATAAAQGASTLQTGTTGGLVSKSAATAKDALTKLESDFNNLSGLQVGGIPATNAIMNYVASKFGQGALSAYQTTLHDARAQLAGVLTATGATTPTGADSMANVYLPDDMTPTQLKEKLAAARALIDQKVSHWTNPSSNNNEGVTTSGVKYTITEK